MNGYAERLKRIVFEFYNDILTYDTDDTAEQDTYESTELYVKTASDFFEEVPLECTAQELVRAIFEDGPENDKSVCLGYVRNEVDVVFFIGDQSKITVKLQPDDKLIIFSCH